ncbi:MAG: autotransporter assembly complex family protein [Methylococcales bacterium]|nr:autotransporter assembly complex family protein [Methylococcales bacterium]
MITFVGCTTGIIQESNPYQVEIKGVADEDLNEKILSYSLMQKQQDSPPESSFVLTQRAKKDIPTFIKLLRSKAYYNAKITIKLDQKETPPRLIFKVNLGPQYALQSVVIHQNTDSLKKPTLKQINLTPDQPALTSTILAAEQKLLTYAKRQSYAFATLCPRKVVVNHDLKTVSVELCLKTGEQVFVGAVGFTGNQNIKADFLKKLIQWQQGTAYNQKTIDSQRLKLIDSRLFILARLKLATKADEDGYFPVTFELKERLPRTVSAGLRLTTDDELFLARFAWEHRNLWGQGEVIDAALKVSMIKSSLAASFRKPVFYHPNNTLIMDSEFISEDTDAFKSLRAEFAVAIEHQLTKKQRFNIGLAYQFSRVTEYNQISENFNLISLPIHFNGDFSDNFLEPTTGGRLSIDEQPFYNLGTGARFHKQKIRYRHYLSLTKSDNLIVAGRIIIGNIWGENLVNIPADLRYFAGGSDTVRGYSFQSLSPKDEQGRLIGGLSLFAFSIELRQWITENIGIVGFLDGGRAYADAYQNFADLKMGAGLGLRYKTPIGAIRFDLARPLNKRDEDDEFQLYMSIGHTF